jgi:hypothetical protein
VNAIMNKVSTKGSTSLAGSRHTLTHEHEVALATAYLHRGLASATGDLYLREWRLAHRMTHLQEVALSRACLEGSLTGAEVAQERQKLRRMRDITNDLLAVSLSQMEDRAMAMR